MEAGTLILKACRTAQVTKEMAQNRRPDPRGHGHGNAYITEAREGGSWKLDVDVEEATPSGSEPARDGRKRTCVENGTSKAASESCNTATLQTLLQHWKPRDTCRNPNPNPNQCPSVVQVLTREPPGTHSACRTGAMRSPNDS